MEKSKYDMITQHGPALLGLQAALGMRGTSSGLAAKMFHTNIIWLAKGFFTHDITFGFPDLSRTPTVDVWC